MQRHAIPVQIVSLLGLVLVPGCLGIPASPPGMADLDTVIQQVETALDEYQTTLGGGPDPLPPLRSADFSFRVTTSRNVGASISLLIFKLGASRQTDTLNEVNFHYEPKAKGPEFMADQNAPPLAEQILATVVAAAEQIKKAKAVQKMPLASVAVTIQFGVKWDSSGGASPKYDIVTVGLNATANRNAVQTVKLVFGK